MCSVVKNPPADPGDMGSIPEWGRSPREGDGNSSQYSCLGNSTESVGPQRDGHDLATKHQQLHQQTRTCDIKHENVSFKHFVKLPI